jgi:hypothetical protein
LAILTAIAAIAAAWAVHLDWSNWRKPEFGERVFPQLAKQLPSVEKIVVDRAGGPLTIIKSSTGWILKQSDNYPVRAEIVQKTLHDMSQLRLLSPKTRLEKRYAKLEVEDPAGAKAKSRRIRLMDGSGTVYADLIVGKQNQYLEVISEGGVYIRKTGSDQSWLAGGTLTVGSEPKSWLRDRIMDIPTAKIRQATIRHANGDQLIVVRSEGKFRLHDMPAGKKLTSSYYPSDIGRALADLELTDARKRGSATFDPAKTVIATFMTADGLRIELNVMEQDGKNWLRVTDVRAARNAPKEGADERTKKIAELQERTGGWDYIVPEFEAVHLKKRIADVLENAKPGT